MTYLVDAKRRVTLPPEVPPGSSVSYLPAGNGRYLLEVLASPARQPPPVAPAGKYCRPGDFDDMDTDEPAFPPLA